MYNLIAIRLGLPRCLLSLIILLTLWSGFGHMAHAQDKVAPEVMAFAREISKSCPHQWEEQACLSDVSASALVLAANYAGDLQSNGMIGAVEQIKQHCAAATAATQGTYPAYAMKSAFTECANKIYDVSEQTSIKPDLSHYQLLIGAIWCMNKDSQCKTIEDQLGAFQ
tara:strand:- start:97 stop:600 length:504 start_codon:yes stop_codon:yes gene_type:complete